MVRCSYRNILGDRCIETTKSKKASDPYYCPAHAPRPEPPVREQRPHTGRPVRFNCVLPPAVDDWLRDRAVRTGTSMTGIVVALLKAEMEKDV